MSDNPTVVVPPVIVQEAQAAAPTAPVDVVAVIDQGVALFRETAAAITHLKTLVDDIHKGSVTFAEVRAEIDEIKQLIADFSKVVAEARELAGKLSGGQLLSQLRDLTSQMAAVRS